MSFVSGLRDELVAAAEREQARRLPRLHAPGPRVVLAVGAAAALLLLVALAVGTLNTRPVERGDRPVATPTPEGRPLFGGTLVPNVRYRTSVFTPRLSFVVVDDRWQAVDTTLAEELRLARVKRGGATAEPPRIQQLVFQRIPEVADPNVRGLKASRMAAPADLYEWLRDHPDLRVGPSRRVTVANVPGERFGVRVEFDRPAHHDPWCRRYEEVPCTFIAPGVNWPDGARLDVTILRTEPDPLVIVMGGMNAADVAAVRTAATPLLESLRIGVR
jgi:hypothetical protein